MQHETVDNLYDKIGALTVNELLALTNMLTEKFSLNIGVQPLAHVPAQQSTRYKVLIEALNGNKIAIIKAVKEIKGLGLKESKDFVDTIVGREEIFDDYNQAQEVLNTYNQIGLKAVMTEIE